MDDNCFDIKENNELIQRNYIKYNEKEINKIRHQMSILFHEMSIKELDNELVIYKNQEKCAKEIVEDLYKNRKLINIMIIALTQSGKTGTMLALIQNYLQNYDKVNNLNIISTENIYIITGLSSCEWINQTKNRMPKSLQERVFHRDNLTTKFVDDIKNKKNVMIIIDEIQIAAKDKQTLQKTFETAGLYNKEILLKNDIKIIEFTATPDGTIYDLMRWGENSLKKKMEPGDGYTSCFDLKNQGRIFQYKDLCGYHKKTNNKEAYIDEELVTKNIKEIQSHIRKYEIPLYHIIRTPN